MGGSGLDVDLEALPWPAALRRTIGLLVRSAPWVLVLHLASVIVSAASGPVSAAAVGAVVAHLSSGMASGVWLAAVVLGVALLTGGLMGSGVDSWGKFVVGERFTGAFERAVMEGVGRIPGLAPFEDPALADTIEVTRWTAAGEFSGGGGVARLYADTMTVLRSLIAAAGAAVVVARWAWWAPLVVVAAEVPAAIITWRHAGLLFAEESAAAEPYRRAAYFLELGFDTDAAKEVRVFGLGPWLADRYRAWWLRAFGAILEDLRRHVRSESALAVARFGAAAVLLAALLGAHRPGPGEITAGILALPLLLANTRALLAWPGQAHRNLAHVPQAAALASVPRVPPSAASWPTSDGEIRFDDVTFSYPGTPVPVLAGLSLVIPAGTSLALVGPNGCGKTSLVKLVCRFYDPAHGRITVDGIDLRDHDPETWRTRIAAILQDFVRYPFDLAENVSLGCGGRPGLVGPAIELAGATDLAERTPSGALLDRSLGGTDLSGGEWQRVALARAMAARLGRDPLLVIADEPTAHLDVSVEADLYRRFTELTAGRTTILTSHRMSTVRMADRIAVMDHGGIVEEGTHEELVGLGGRYAHMYELQARRYRETGTTE